ncbi:hypothetical protein PTI98_010659 [Pleurotus ostreatus]|nr:hypothetical protein PTI98_010659 [Pleurotus ostreatus]
MTDIPLPAKSNTRHSVQEVTPARPPLASHSSNPPPETPRKSTRNAMEGDQHTSLREEIANLMNAETLECGVESFIKHYLPAIKLPEGVSNDMRVAGSNAVRDAFQDYLSGGKHAEGQKPSLSYNSEPCKWNTSSIPGGNFKIDGGLVNEEKSQRVTDTIVAMEFKNQRDIDQVLRNREQLLSAILHIMNDDIRRMFMFGITIERVRMNLWYFSRSHSIKSQSFEFVNHPEILVDVLIRLLFADEKDLGIDPNIALNSRDQYVYTVDGTRGRRRFQVVAPIFESRALTTTCRMTRVFRVLELEGETDDPKADAKAQVLKDYWLEKDSKTEVEIQEQLFADIAEFAKFNWRESIYFSVFNKNDKTTQEIMGAFETLLQDEEYKRLFLVIQDRSLGECSREAEQSAWLPQFDTLRSTVTPHAAEPFPTTQRSSRPQSGARRDLQARPVDEAPQVVYKNYMPKQRSFLIFDDECTRVHCLPTVGDVFRVLRDCLTALHLMFCAGWVHRDISCNNVMAIQDPETRHWNLKLADLEYSKKYDSGAGTSDPKIGTPFFMPCEILRGSYFGLDPEPPDPVTFSTKLTSSVSAVDDPPVRFNFLHDLEATYWTGLWITTCRVNCEESRIFGFRIFDNNATLTLSQARLKAFERPISRILEKCLLPELKGLPPNCFEHARQCLHGAAVYLGRRQAWDNKDEGYKRYSAAHGALAVSFAFLADPAASWASVPLQRTDSKPRSLGAQPAIVEVSGKEQVRDADEYEYRDDGVEDEDPSTAGRRRKRTTKDVSHRGPKTSKRTKLKQGARSSTPEQPEASTSTRRNPRPKRR